MVKVQNDNWLRFLIPKEHGSWAMWVLPFIIGVAEAGKLASETVLIFAACSMIFFARTALSAAIRFRRRDKTLAFKCAFAGIVEIVVVTAFALSIVLSGNYAIALIGLVATALLFADLWWIKDRSERSLLAEFSGIAGFSLTAPTAYVATTGTWTGEAFLLWTIAFMYFAGSVFYVKLRVIRMSQNLHRKSHLERFYSRLNLSYVVMLVAATTLLSIFTRMPGWMIFAFLPWIVHILWDVLQWKPKQSIYRIGWSLVAHALYFTVFVSLTFAFN